MVIRLALGTLLVTSLLGCSRLPPHSPPPQHLDEVFIKDFRSAAPLDCTTADVALTHTEAAIFFSRAHALSPRQIADNYPAAPCFVEGTLLADGELCDWRITAAATGLIRCGPNEWHFACDDCDDILSN
ncbi:hypothetical protein ACUH78_15435 [Thauera sp. ZXT1-4]|uniref:hypothetical protein n=1 Tax=Thauera sp. ZXT1-4 TaxID=3460294 RepID=UPI0040406ED6